MPKSTIRITQIFRLDQYERLLAESAATGAPLVELVRRAVDAKYPPKKRKP